VNDQDGATDQVITKACLKEQLENNFSGEVLAIRTLPNNQTKQTRQYSNANPPYLTLEAMNFINEIGVQHLMVDTPSVDREVDNGALVCHHAFWSYPENIQQHKTITELIYIPDIVIDGVYLFEIQIISLEMDASPSKIMVYELKSDQV
jgi:kynurenine formamidase